MLIVAVLVVGLMLNVSTLSHMRTYIRLSDMSIKELLNFNIDTLNKVQQPTLPYSNQYFSQLG